MQAVSWRLRAMNTGSSSPRKSTQRRAPARSALARASVTRTGCTFVAAARPRWIDISKGPALQAGVNPFSKGLEVADALNLVIGQLDVEMIFEAREHFQRLQAVDAEFLEKIVSRRERSHGQLKMLCRQV